MKDLLDLRKRLNKKRPRFERCDSYKRKEVSPSWRKPKGLQNKMRLERHGKPAVVKSGYRNPSAVRFLSSSGLMPVLVYCARDLEGIDNKKQGVLLGNIGGRLKVTLLEVCKKKGLSVLNVKNVDDEINRLKSIVEERKKAKAERKAKEPEKKPAKKEVKEKPEKKEKEESPEDAKKQERKEMEKVLTKRQ